MAAARHGTSWCIAPSRRCGFASLREMEEAAERARHAKPRVASGVGALVTPALSPGAAGEVRAGISADGLGEEEAAGAGGGAWRGNLEPRAFAGGL